MLHHSSFKKYPTYPYLCSCTLLLKVLLPLGCPTCKDEKYGSNSDDRSVASHRSNKSSRSVRSVKSVKSGPGGGNNGDRNKLLSRKKNSLRYECPFDNRVRQNNFFDALEELVIQ
mmetsp:Transcript_33970/g.64654  ORF Transcript_33970/g.64654 Transcript_33970/m.64654 type:complete len:115 (-) Transcript_33970:1644-1988(-)